MRRRPRSPTKQRDGEKSDLHKKLYNGQKIAIEITLFILTLWGLYKILATLIVW